MRKSMVSFHGLWSCASLSRSCFARSCLRRSFRMELSTMLIDSLDFRPDARTYAEKKTRDQRNETPVYMIVHVDKKIKHQDR